MFCGKCGNQTEDSAAFCGKCGSPMDGAAPVTAGESGLASKQGKVKLFGIAGVALVAVIVLIAVISNNRVQSAAIEAEKAAIQTMFEDFAAAQTSFNTSAQRKFFVSGSELDMFAATSESILDVFDILPGVGPLVKNLAVQLAGLLGPNVISFEYGADSIDVDTKANTATVTGTITVGIDLFIYQESSTDKFTAELEKNEKTENWQIRSME